MPTIIKNSVIRGIKIKDIPSYPFTMEYLVVGGGGGGGQYAAGGGGAGGLVYCQNYTFTSSNVNSSLTVIVGGGGSGGCGPNPADGLRGQNGISGESTLQHCEKALDPLKKVKWDIS